MDMLTKEGLRRSRRLGPPGIWLMPYWVTPAMVILEPDRAGVQRMMGVEPGRAGVQQMTGVQACNQAASGV
jgi:hypothetical protein